MVSKKKLRAFGPDLTMDSAVYQRLFGVKARLQVRGLSFPIRNIPDRAILWNDIIASENEHPSFLRTRDFVGPWLGLYVGYFHEDILEATLDMKSNLSASGITVQSCASHCQSKCLGTVLEYKWLLLYRCSFEMRCWFSLVAFTSLLYPWRPPKANMTVIVHLALVVQVRGAGPLAFVLCGWK